MKIEYIDDKEIQKETKFINVIPDLTDMNIELQFIDDEDDNFYVLNAKEANDLIEALKKAIDRLAKHVELEDHVEEQDAVIITDEVKPKAKKPRVELNK